MPAAASELWWAAPSRYNDLAADDLDEHEQQRLDTFQSAPERRRYLVAHVLLRAVLGKKLEVSAGSIVFDRSCGHCGKQHGKPVVLQHNIHVSLSHAGDRVLVGLSEHAPIGVDVEQLSATRFDGFDSIALTVTERGLVADLPVDRQPWARARYWTRKESVLKATGDGLVIPPTALEMSAPGDPPDLVAWPGHTERFHLMDLDLGDGYTGCAAIRSSEPIRWTLSDGGTLLEKLK